MRAGLVGIFVFVALLALGHYVAAPFFCRGGFAIPTFDSRALCGADMHLNRSGSMLLYFGAIAIAFVIGALAGALPGKRTAEPQPAASSNDAAETFEQILAAEEKKQADTGKTENAPAAKTEAAAESAAATTENAAKAAPEAAASAEATATPAAKESATALEVKTAETEPKKSDDAAKAETGSASVATAEAITLGLSAAKNGIRGTFEGSNEDLIARFRELKKQEGVNSIAQAQRLLDESTMAALAKGLDPKQHLSDVAHLVLAEDPDLQSGVVRGVVVHIAARLKELGVANKLPATPTKGAA